MPALTFELSESFAFHLSAPHLIPGELEQIGCKLSFLPGPQFPTLSNEEGASCSHVLSSSIAGSSCDLCAFRRLLYPSLLMFSCSCSPLCIRHAFTLLWALHSGCTMSICWFNLIWFNLNICFKAKIRTGRLRKVVQSRPVFWPGSYCGQDMVWVMLAKEKKRWVARRVGQSFAGISRGEATQLIY